MSTDGPIVRRALISVSDKQGVAALARGLVDAGVEIFSTGGTRRHLESEGLNVRDLAQYTGFPEMMDGRVKTLHPKVFAGILCRRDRPDDMASIEQHEILSIDLVVVNLYPFQATVAREGVTFAEAIEQIDIGGPSLVRAAAKNHAFVTVATDSQQYAAILEQVSQSGSTSSELRRHLAAEAFAHTASYDQAIAEYVADQASGGEEFPASLNIPLRLKATLRYGENPHQQAAVYALSGASTGANLMTARQLSGKELSYNNLLDLDSALAMVRVSPTPAVAVIKHNNPCGAATADILADAARAAMDGDPQSAFGSVLGVNRPLDAATAEVLVEPSRFIEAIVAPSFDPDALEILTSRPKWKANVRLMQVGPLEAAPPVRQFRSIEGGLLVQQADSSSDTEGQWKVVTEKQPDDVCLADLRFAWSTARHVKSNAIVLVSGRALVGVGAGQMSRVDAVQIAIRKAGDRAAGAVLGSDAFFPFADSIDEAAAAGVAAVIQPGGSRRDDEVIDACNRHGLPMIFTGRRHFRH